MTATPALTTDLKAQVKLLADDLQQRLDNDPTRLADWKRTHHEAQTKERTAMSWVEWREDRIDQAAVAWVLTTVFIRFCEDNSLVKPVWFTGPGRRQEALDGYNAYFRANPEHSDREWLESAISYLRQLPATRGLVDAHSALDYVSPSGDGVGKLREFWLQRDDDGVLIHDLHDESLSTRFLGDLYQDLSDYAKEKYALLQTPVFVEEHILDRTLEPALNDRPLDGFRMIDPTCGSGHFLLGAFDRLLDRWHKHAPGMEIQAKVQTALDAIHGVDLNPFAVAIARFRLTVAALKVCELRSLEDAPAFKFHLATGDSLIHGPDSGTLPGMADRSAFMSFYYTTEDGPLLLELLEEGRYDAVVGNPPYITPKDTALNQVYRSKFKNVCKGKYALTVPFIAQFFALAKRGDQAGWVGLITSNSFMKRGFGAKLIEDFLARRDLRLVEDTSGAFIPGHGTPTVIIVGRNRFPTDETVRAVLGVRGEAAQPDDPAHGVVWTSIVDHVNDANWNDAWITVTDLDRKILASHPWSLTGGGAVELKQALEVNSKLVSHMVESVGFAAISGNDDLFVVGNHPPVRWQVAGMPTRPFVEGEKVRDFVIENPAVAAFPYVAGKPVKETVALAAFWEWRTILRCGLAFGQTREDKGMKWWEYILPNMRRISAERLISFASVATHNHFVLDRDTRVFKQSAPVIKLADSAPDEDYFGLLGILNSSTACFWLKQECYAKTGTDNNSGGGNRWSPEPWYSFYDFSARAVEDCPLPRNMPLRRTILLDSLAQESRVNDPRAIISGGSPSRDNLQEARRASEYIRAHMVSVQEELDWEVYALYGLIDEDLTYEEDDLPRLALGERAFEIALARSGMKTAWFERHGATPITEIPERWPTQYKKLVQRRLDLISAHPFIRVLEKPEYKRRWAQDPWDDRQEQALQEWLLVRLEDRRFWFDAQGRPSPRSVAQLADDVTRDTDMLSVLALWEGRPDVPVVDSLERLLEDEAVPFHSGYRYKESGLRKRVAWEDTWARQRHADAGEEVQIDVPPKYVSADFAKPSYWKHRGRLDVPKERFILYPDASRDGDGTPLLGWAGWDHAEQALALASVIHDREQEGWPDKRLIPLVAGLAELQPWVDQWHGEIHPLYGVSLAAFCAEELARRAAQVSMTIEELRWWRPEKKKGRGRGKA